MSQLEEDKRKALEEAAIKEEEDRLEEAARRAEEEKAKSAETVAQETEEINKGGEPFMGNNMMGFFKRRREEVISSEKDQDINYAKNVEFTTIEPEILDVDVEVFVERKKSVQNSARSKKV